MDSSSTTPTTEASPRVYHPRYSIDEIISLTSSTSGQVSETNSFIYNPSSASGQTSIASYKTEKSITSRKSRYNVLPRHKYAGLEHSRSPLGPISSDDQDTSASETNLKDKSVTTTQHSASSTSITIENNATIIKTIIDILRARENFRLLTIGPSGVGKSSLINCIFGIKNASVSQNRPGLGVSDIDQEHVSQENEYVVLHHSEGFAGPANVFNFKIVRSFLEQRSHKTLPLRDRVHCLWLLAETPTEGGRVFEASGDEELCKIVQTINIPIVMVFTKYDRLVRTKRGLLKKIHPHMDDQTLDSRSVEEASKAFEKCLQFLGYTMRRLKIQLPPYARVSDRPCPGFPDGISELVEVTRKAVKERLYSLIMWDIARLPVRVEASVMKVLFRVDLPLDPYKLYNSYTSLRSLDSSGYTRILADRGAHVGRKLLRDHLTQIHKDVVTCWNFDGAILYSNEFKQLMLYLVQDVCDDQPHDPSPQKISQFVNLVTATDEPILPPIAILDFTYKFTQWLSTTVLLNEAPVQRLLFAYTVDLISVLRGLFAITLGPESKPPLTWSDLTEALEAYAQSLSRQCIHKSICSYTPQHGWNLAENEIRNKLRELLNK